MRSKTWIKGKEEEKHLQAPLPHAHTHKHTQCQESRRRFLRFHKRFLLLLLLLLHLLGFPGRTSKHQARHRCRAAFVDASSDFALRDYRKAVACGLEAGSTATWEHIAALWNDLGPTFDEQDGDSLPSGESGISNGADA